MGSRVRALLAAAVVAASLVAGQAPGSAATLEASEADLVARVNAFRASMGLPTLVVSDTLTSAARWMSTDMASRDYFSHTSLDGRGPQQRMADAGYPAFDTWTGEDLAAGFADAADVLAGWIASPAHYAVLTNPAYRAIGIGRAYGVTSSYGWYWAADLGGIVDATSPVAVDATTPLAVDGGYHAAWSGQSPDPTLAPGEIATLVVALENTGSNGWYVGVPGRQANLGTSAPTDVERPELAYGWLSPNRPATTTTAYVGPGEVGWSQFQVRAPSTPGTYRFDLRGVVDGTTWLEDQGIFFTLTVR